MGRMSQMSKSQRIRAIFEGNVIAMYSPDDERYKAAEKANRRRVSMQAQARAEQARGSHETAGQKTISTLGKNLSPEMLRKVMQKDIKAHHERRRKSMNSSTEYYRAGLRALFESVIEEVSKREMQRQANRDYWAGEGKDFKGAGRKLKNLTKKFKAKQPEKSLFRTPDPNDPNDWGIDPIPDENVNVGGKSSKGPDKSDEKMRSPHFN